MVNSTAKFKNETRILYREERGVPQGAQRTLRSSRILCIPCDTIHLKSYPICLKMKFRKFS